MFALFRFSALVYVLGVFTCGYLAVSMLKGIWTQADRLQNLAAISIEENNRLANTLLVFDAIEPASGDGHAAVTDQ